METPKYEYVKVFKKTITAKDTKSKFDTFYGYIMKGDKTSLTEYVKDNVAITIRVKFGLDMFNKVKREKFPLMIHLKETTPDEPIAYFITKDKDKDGNVRYDKNGNWHYVLVITDTDEYYKAPIETKTTLSDILG